MRSVCLLLKTFFGPVCSCSSIQKNFKKLQEKRRKKSFFVSNFFSPISRIEIQTVAIILQFCNNLLYLHTVLAHISRINVSCACDCRDNSGRTVIFNQQNPQ